jgi:hypothetical protein
MTHREKMIHLFHVGVFQFISCSNLFQVRGGFQRVSDGDGDDDNVDV